MITAHRITMTLMTIRIRMFDQYYCFDFPSPSLSVRFAAAVCTAVELLVTSTHPSRNFPTTSVIVSGNETRLAQIRTLQQEPITAVFTAMVPLFTTTRPQQTYGNHTGCDGRPQWQYQGAPRLWDRDTCKRRMNLWYGVQGGVLQVHTLYAAGKTPGIAKRINPTSVG